MLTARLPCGIGPRTAWIAERSWSRLHHRHYVGRGTSAGGRAVKRRCGAEQAACPAGVRRDAWWPRREPPARLLLTLKVAGDPVTASARMTWTGLLQAHGRAGAVHALPRAAPAAPGAGGLGAR